MILHQTPFVSIVDAIDAVLSAAAVWLLVLRHVWRWTWTGKRKRAAWRGPPA